MKKIGGLISKDKDGRTSLPHDWEIDISILTELVEIKKLLKKVLEVRKQKV